MGTVGIVSIILVACVALLVAYKTISELLWLNGSTPKKYHGSMDY